MRLVVGLGNPGVRYEKTRHNVGCVVTDSLRDACSRATKWEHLFDGWLARVVLGDQDVTLLEPRTFMNRSGRSIHQTMTHLSLEPEDLVVIHDDLDLPFGTVKVKVGGGAGGHRGLLSCFDELETRSFVRVRVGIGRPEAEGIPTDYVLEPFDTEQTTELSDVVERAAEAVRATLEEGAVAAMNRFNRRIIEVIAEGGEP